MSAKTAAELEALAKLAYVAAAEDSAWKDAHGDPLPPWEQLPSRSRSAWRAAVRALERALS